IGVGLACLKWFNFLSEVVLKYGTGGSVKWLYAVSEARLNYVVHINGASHLCIEIKRIHEQVKNQI
ncbi:hypothetical protein KTV79_11500, partial [Planococcus sp. CP5-4_UN]|nr:hypothetical protein [Planococcus sp. CP5-4_UN]